ncbi:MAG: diguanylate cyclase, partial [Desulfobacterales bacterium]|nr:diguanylate cyclase [Desulfobacterales bacterium]
LFQKRVYEKKRCDGPEITFCSIKNLYETHKKDIDALTLLDANGIMLHMEPYIKGRPRMHHSDKPGVAYVIKEHKLHISEVYYNNLGNLAISILEPIFYKDKFTGIVRWMIETDTIAKRFIEPVKIGKNGFVWVFDNKNIIISHPRKDFIGMTVLDVIKKVHKEKNKFFDESLIQEHIQEKHDYLNRVRVEKEGAGVFINCVTNENDIIAYKRVQAGNATFNLIITLPYSEIIGPVHKHAAEIFGLAGFVIILLSAGGLALFRSQKEKARLETEARYLKQIANGAKALAAERDRRMEFSKQLEEANRQLKRLTFIDGLTGIANRRHFDEFLEKEWQRNMRDNKPVSLIMADIDFFKNYNDRYGHQAGDDCLKQVAAILNNMTKRPGDLAARYGGEEFAVILSGTDLKLAGMLAENANKKLRETRIPHSDSQVADYVTLSFGVASIIPKYDAKPYDLIEAADKALYKAINNGRNQVVLYV